MGSALVYFTNGKHTNTTQFRRFDREFMNSNPLLPAVSLVSMPMVLELMPVDLAYRLEYDLRFGH